MALPNIVPHPTPNPNPNVTPWHALEMSTCAVPALWQRRCGEDFEQFKDALLRPGTKQARSYPCQICGLNMAVSIEAPDNIIALCHECPQNCQGMHLTAEDIEVLELDWQKLAGGLCRAFEFRPTATECSLHNTCQIGTWSSDAVPVFLTIQHERYDFQYVVMSLVAIYHCKFILLAPTSAHLGANCQRTLASVGAAFFPLDSNVIITEEGTLKCRTAPGQLFAQFNPQPVDDEQMLRNAIALVKAADSEQDARRVSLYMVMRLYCFDSLNPGHVARKCGCARSTIYERLAELHQKLGRDPAEFRQYASQFESIKNSLTDPRAKSIHLKSAIYGDEEAGE